jgi:hypothetical protein
MSVQSGNTSVSIVLPGQSVNSDIGSFSIVNRSVGSVNVTVYIISSECTPIAITADPVTLSAGQAYLTDTTIKMLANSQIYIETNGNIDYYFSITP